LQAIADEHGLQLMFDAAHAFGCSQHGQMIGNFGRAEVLSFHATKFFNTFEGGAVVTNDDALADTMRLMRNFGFAGIDRVVAPGTNGKMPEVCAAMGLANLDCIDSVVEVNYRNYRAYQEALAGIAGLSILDFDETGKNNFQYVVLQVSEDCSVSRDHLIDALRAENVLARKYFWPGCHRMQPYRDLYPAAASSLESTEAVADRVIVLPTGTAVDVADIKVIGEIASKLTNC
jgi:dTDP-4-amino-4,6-dideoxygalactose transaminase